MYQTLACSVYCVAGTQSIIEPHEAEDNPQRIYLDICYQNQYWSEKEKKVNYKCKAMLV